MTERRSGLLDRCERSPAPSAGAWSESCALTRTRPPDADAEGLDGLAEAENECPAGFGDDREDYAAAMAHHYEHGAPADWEQRFVSACATMHPWEDWAESCAHYLHIRDTLQTAEAYGVRVDGPHVATTDLAPLHSDPEAPTPDIEALLDACLPLTYALNAINRSMGAADVYPFVLTSEVQRKLAFVDRCVRAAAPL